MADRLVVVRHAKAGHRTRWHGDDRIRPLTKKGWRQAERLVATLRPLRPGWLLSSPYVRCRQTLQPLSDALGLTIHEEEGLAEGNAVESLLVIGRAAPAEAACLSTHGDLVEDLLRMLLEAGLVQPPQALGEKAGSWMLELERDLIRSARYLPPPA